MKVSGRPVRTCPVDDSDDRTVKVAGEVAQPT